MELKVFELYSGIGGMHFALKESKLNVKVRKAVDINPKANEVYKLNFPEVSLLEKNIQGLDDSDFNTIGADMIMMSPPCQPFTRNGLRKDMMDPRNLSILHVIKLIPKLKTIKYLLLENVKGFEVSDVKSELVKTLSNSGFLYQEFLLSPDQFGIPNSRLRYYLLAKKAPLKFCFTTKNEIFQELPNLQCGSIDILKANQSAYKTLSSNDSCFQVESILSEEEGDSVSDNRLQRYGSLLDIVTKKSVRSCCFTKSYGSYVEGTGSVFTPLTNEYIEDVFQKLKKCEKGTPEYLNLMRLLKLRYFSPKEVSRLMCFPDNFKFPKNFSNKEKYKLLGNSINVHVVAVLTRLLLS